MWGVGAAWIRRFVGFGYGTGSDLRIRESLRILECLTLSMWIDLVFVAWAN